MGVGKSGHIAQKISATLSSTGTPSIFIHPTGAAHGDMGIINKKDIVMLISNSGETEEIINILSSLKRHAKEIVALSGNNKSSVHIIFYSYQIKTIHLLKPSPYLEHYYQ